MGTSHSRTARALVLAGGLVLVPITACTGNEETTGTSVLTEAEDAVESATSAAGSAAEDVDSNVDCSGDSCTVTLSPDADEVEVLGTTVSYDGVEDGEATMTVGDETVSCAEGDTVEAGPLSLECTTVSEDELSFTATLG